MNVMGCTSRLRQRTRVLPRFFCVLIVLVLSAFAFVQTTLAASYQTPFQFPLSNVGGIVLTAPEIEGTNLAFSPSSAPTDEQRDWPTVELTGNALNFPQGLTLTKTVDMSSTSLAAYGVAKAVIKITIPSATSLSTAAIELSGIDCNEVNFVTGVNSSGEPVITDASGNETPLAQLNITPTSPLQNVTLNVHSMSLADFNWSQASIQIIAANSQGNPVNVPNGTFTYDSNYDNSTPDPGLNAGGIVSGSPAKPAQKGLNPVSPPIGFVPKP